MCTLSPCSHHTESCSTIRKAGPRKCQVMRSSPQPPRSAGPSPQVVNSEGDKTQECPHRGHVLKYTPRRVRVLKHTLRRLGLRAPNALLEGRFGNRSKALSPNSATPILVLCTEGALGSAYLSNCKGAHHALDPKSKPQSNLNIRRGLVT